MLFIFSDHSKGFLDLVDAAGVSVGVGLAVPRCDTLLGVFWRNSFTLLSKDDVGVFV